MYAIRTFARRFDLLRRLNGKLSRLKKTVKDYFWQFYQKWRMILIASSSSKKVQLIRASLSEKSYPDGSIITITFGSRKFGNIDNRLVLFMDSFLEVTHYPKRVEILIKIDDDDDLLFFYWIKRKYSERVNVRFFLGPRGRGYEDMHIWHHELISYRNPAAKLHYILTDDAVFEFRHWDDRLLSLLEKRGGDTYFIGTACKLEEAITYHGPNPVFPEPVYWIRGDDYPIYGFDLLCSAAKAAVDLPGWTEFGNLQLVDQYAGALLRTAWMDFDVNLHEEIDLYASRRGNFAWSDSPKRTEIRTRTLNKFFNEESKIQRKKIVLQILSDVELKRSLISTNEAKL
jgi:hypothetical protein